jgi:uncharacterized protein (TIGR02466 family)
MGQRKDKRSQRAFTPVSARGGEPACPSDKALEIRLRQAAALRDAGRLQEAMALCRRILELQPQNPAALGLAATIAWHRSDYNEALALASRVVALSPGDAEAHSNLGAVLQSLGKWREAIACYERACGLRPTYLKAWLNLGSACLQAGNHERALAGFRKALKIDANSAVALSGIGACCRKLGRADDAVRALERAKRAQPGDHAVLYNLAAALGDTGRAGEALAAGAAALAARPGDTRTLALKAALHLEAGERDAAGALLDFARLISVADPSAPDGQGAAADFNAALATHLAAHPTLRYEPPTKATKVGWQSGEILMRPEGPVRALKAMIVQAVEAYLAAHSADPSHPFLARPPARWRLKGWATVLGPGGHQTSHIHPLAWLSGCYYVQVPDEIVRAAARPEGWSEGWIEFGRPAAEMPTTAEPLIHLVEPLAGRIVLFPSYFNHRTIPFTAEEKRISVAFDVIPEA